MPRETGAFTPGAVYQERYEVLSKIGEGGFGVVYSARLLSTKQLIALKTMRLSGDEADPKTPQRVARFLREAQLCARLHHPNIVQLIDAGQSEDSLFSAFAFAQGENLAALLAKEGALEPREVKHLMAQVLDALACAHAQGVVHRDLKPSNIMVTATGARRNALVLDFGIGAFWGKTDASARLTLSTDTLGTPGYGAPEQWRGSEVAPQADLFSWGVVFLECLTGRPVYGGSAQADIIYQQMGPDPVPIPPALADHPLGALLRRATEKDPGAREISALALLNALESCDLAGLSRATFLDRQPGAFVGFSQSGVGTATSTETSQRSSIPGERRQVTALCCCIDMVPSRLQVLDSEEKDGLLGESFKAFVDIALAHKGRIASVLGNKVLFYFGLPLAEEGDAHRAGRAGLAMIRVAASENARLSPRGVCLEVRVGLHTGLVVTNDLFKTQNGSPLIGGTPALASRLASLARVDTILASSESQRLLRGIFELEEQGGPTGLPGDMRAFRLKQEKPVEPAHTTATVAKTKLVGRAHELQMLAERWRRARDGVGQCGLVVGEPGIGKTRLINELLTHVAGAEHWALEARCSPDTQANALFPIIELVEKACGLDRKADQKAQTAKVEAQLASCGLDLSQAMPLFLDLCSLPVAPPYAPLDVSARKQLELTFEGLIAFLCGLAEKQPLFLLMEDLHWADPTTLEFLTRLVREAPSAPMFVVFTARPDFSPPFATVGVLAIPLNRLESSDVEAMVADLVDHNGISPAAVAEVVKRSDGNPLFVEELTMMMVESGLLENRDGQYELAAPLSDSAMPGSLLELLTARLDRLGSAKETAQIAAALGKEFSVGILASISAVGPEVVERHLVQLVQAGLCVRRHRSEHPVATFKHALVRDAAYDSLSRSAKSALHARIAAVLEERFPDLARTRPDLLAQHQAAAGRMEQAIPYGQQAAEQALRRCAYPEALTHTSKIVEWTKSLSSDTTSAVLAANSVSVQALMATRGWADPQVKDVVDDSFAIAQRSGPSNPYKIPMLWSMFAYHNTACHHASALAVADELAATAERLADHVLRATAVAARGAILLVMGQSSEASAALRRAIDIYERNEPCCLDPRFGMDSLVIAKGLLAHIAWFDGNDSEALGLIASGISRAREMAHIPSLAIGLLYGAQVYEHAYDKAKTAACTGELLALAGQYGLPAYEGYGALLHGWATNNEQHVDAIVEVLGRLGCTLGLAYYSSLIADNMASRGDFESAIGRIDTCLALCLKVGEHYYEPVLHWRQANYRIQRGDTREDVRRSLEDAALLAKRYGLPRVEALARGEILSRFGEEGIAPLAARTS